MLVSGAVLIPLWSLLASLGLPAPQMPGDGMGEGFEAAALARAGQAGEQRVGIHQGLVETSPATHPVEVAAGVLFGLLAAGGCEADDALPHQLPFAGAGAAIAAPAAGGIDGDHTSAHHRAAPVGELLHIAGGQLAGVGAIAEGDGVEALASAAHIDAHHSARGGSSGTGVHGQGLWFPIEIRSARR
jgi:hypothetical protein